MRISDWSSDVCSSDLLDTAIFGCATAVLADKTHGVRIVHHDHGVEFIGQVANGFQVGNNAIHGKHTIGGNQLVACASGIGRLQLCPQIGHIVIGIAIRSEEHTSELQSLMRISYAVFCLKKKKKKTQNHVLHKKQ